MSMSHTHLPNFYFISTIIQGTALHSTMKKFIIIKKKEK